MAYQSREEEEGLLLLDLYDPSQEEKKRRGRKKKKEELLLLDFDEIVVRPGVKSQPPREVLSSQSTETATATGLKETSPQPAQQSISSGCQESSDDTSKKAASSSTSVPPETPSAATKEAANLNFWDLHRHLAGLGEKEARYRELNQKAPGRPGELTPKFVTDLINHAEGSMCFHTGAFTKQEKNWQKCAKCKAYQPDFTFECKGCNTLLCLRCKIEVQDRRY
ncbi:hypothetical protein TWF788_007757 [Orbilia oligospora]|uniref:Uncharacterized protein n=1 Tax=Orbilia oligospora TaxID=2813651 RepID=A0A7C8PRV5_ORBOL|nr:hypothetical protein TWF788_007757 [Orbilia oligospora]